MAGNPVIAFKISPFAHFTVATFFCHVHLDPYGHHNENGGGEANTCDSRKRKRSQRKKEARGSEDRSEEKKTEAWTSDMNTVTPRKYSCLR